MRSTKENNKKKNASLHRNKGIRRKKKNKQPIDNNNIIIDGKPSNKKNQTKLTYPNGLVTIVIEITSW